MLLQQCGILIGADYAVILKCNLFLPFKVSFIFKIFLI